MSAKTGSHHWGHCVQDNSLVSTDHAQYRSSLGRGCGMPAWETGLPGDLAFPRASCWAAGRVVATKTQETRVETACCPHPP